MDAYFLITDKKMLKFAEDWKARYWKSQVSNSEFARKMGAESYYSGFDNELIALPILDPIPSGWTTNKKLGRMFPAKGSKGDQTRKEIGALDQPPTYKELREMLKLPGRLSYKYDECKGSSSISLSHNPIHSVELLWAEKKFILLIADPRPEIEALKKEHPECVIEYGEWTLPKGLKQITRNEWEFLYAKAKLSAEKKNAKKK